MTARDLPDGMQFGSALDMVEEGPTDTVRHEIINNNERVTCKVSREALMDMVGARELEPGELLSIAQNHFDELIDAWAIKIKRGHFEPDGTVLLRSRELA